MASSFLPAVPSRGRVPPFAVGLAWVLVTVGTSACGRDPPRHGPLAVTPCSIHVLPNGVADEHTALVPGALVSVTRGFVDPATGATVPVASLDTEPTGILVPGDDAFVLRARNEGTTTLRLVGPDGRVLGARTFEVRQPDAAEAHSLTRRLLGETPEHSRSVTFHAVVNRLSPIVIRYTRDGAPLVLGGGRLSFDDSARLVYEPGSLDGRFAFYASQLGPSLLDDGDISHFEPSAALTALHLLPLITVVGHAPEEVSPPLLVAASESEAVDGSCIPFVAVHELTDGSTFTSGAWTWTVHVEGSGRSFPGDHELGTYSFGNSPGDVPLFAMGYPFAPGSTIHLHASDEPRDGPPTPVPSSEDAPIAVHADPALGYPPVVPSGATCSASSAAPPESAWLPVFALAIALAVTRRRR